jgi:alpha-beta hydrolase superfamily lysophospholipase
MRAAALLLAASLGTAQAAIQEEVVTLPAAAGGTLPYLRGFEDGQAPRAIAVLFNGGFGNVGLATRGIPRPGANFLVRTRNAFNREGVATAAIDVPSHLAEMSDAYRMSRSHADDVAAVARDMKRRFGDLPVYLVGTSRGTVSAAYAGAALGTDIAGVVLTASMFNAARSGPGISGFDYSKVKAKLLFVHHADDGCFATPYPMAEAVSRGHPLVTVKGGSAPKSGPCDPFSPHGFFGVEAPTVRAITGWMLTGKAPGSVGD